ncbi:MAG: guanylate kinase [Steroidobacteraceae bacterium]
MAGTDTTAVPGHLYVIAAPSGAGKTSLVKALLAQEPSARFSISYTTRKQRSAEVDGRDYFFVDRARFEQMVAAGEFLEHALVFDNYYGTARAQVEQLLTQGANVILEIDWQGARQIRGVMQDCRSIFILPPSRAELERRLRNRGTDDETVIQRRLRDAVSDMSHWAEFDYVVVNADFDQALAELKAIVLRQGDALRADRPALKSLIAELLTR